MQHRLSSFLERLLNILASDQMFIRWSSDGRSIVIEDKVKLIQEITQFQKFYQVTTILYQGQLNLYYFKSSKNENGKTLFTNPYFRRDHIEPTKLKNKLQIKKEKGEIKQEQVVQKQYVENPIEPLRDDLIECQQMLDRLLENQRLLQQQFQLSVHIYSILIKRISALKYRIEYRKEFGNNRRQKLMRVIRELFQNFNYTTSGIQIQLRLGQKAFLMNNHDVVCNCNQKLEEYITPLMSPCQLRRIDSDYYQDSNIYIPLMNDDSALEWMA
ncbi:hypothetical protein pb186bvf_006932 [Paramecium bursaria]